MLKNLKIYFPVVFDFYKHILRKKKIKEIKALKRMPESEYPLILAEQYERLVGHKLDWNNLVTYTEKMQWEKLYDKNPLKVQLADKYLVRNWVGDKIGNEYLIPILGVWDNFNQIDFSSLPDKFVLKTNHGSGTNMVVKDKNELNKRRAARTFDDWLNTDYAYCSGFEMHYSEIKPMIIAEQYIEDKLGELQDYKFLCFDGKPYYCWVDKGRYSNHTRNVYDLNWNLQPWNQASYGIYKNPIERPINFGKMVELATILAQGFSHVRVDFYNIEGTIYFGEMTFTNGSGLDAILPVEYDKMLGDLWNLPMHK